MKHKSVFLGLIIFSALFISCSPNKLYYWGQYNQATYNYNKKKTDKSIENLIKVYEDIIEKKDKGTRNSVPPGVYADYGYLLIQTGEIDKGKQMLEQELQLYPESKKIIEYILNRL